MSAGAYDPAGDPASGRGRSLAAMRIDLGQLIRDVPLRTLALAIAIGYALLETARGLGYFITVLTEHGHDVGEAFSYGYGGTMTWVWGHHVFSFGQLATGLVELGAVLLVAALVQRYSRAS